MSSSGIAVGMRRDEEASTGFDHSQRVEWESYDCLLGCSDHVKSLRKFLSWQAVNREPTLLIGSPGLRHAQLARAIHDASKYPESPFTTVEVCSSKGEALGDLLFGPKGLLSGNPRGTVLISGLTGFPDYLQERVSAYLNGKLNGVFPADHSVQLIFVVDANSENPLATSNVDPELANRLMRNSYVIKPLRERSVDLSYLIKHLLVRVSLRLNKIPCHISPHALALLSAQKWERNIDELEGVLEGIVNSLPPQMITLDNLPHDIRHSKLNSIPPEGIDLYAYVGEFEKSLIEAALGQANGKQTEAARLLKMTPQTLNSKLKRYHNQMTSASTPVTVDG